MSDSIARAVTETVKRAAGMRMRRGTWSGTGTTVNVGGGTVKVGAWLIPPLVAGDKVLIFAHDGQNIGVAMSSRDTAWTALTLTSPWTPYGSGFQAPSYRRLSDGMVMVQGLAKGGSAATNTALATMPAGYRPPASVLFPGAAFGDAASRFGNIQFLSTGAVVLDQWPAVTYGWVNIFALYML